MKYDVMALFVAVLLSAGCSKERISGSGSITTEDRPGLTFTGISMAGANNVHITKDSFFRVQVKGYANLLPYYETRVVNGVLKLGYRDVNIKNDNIEVIVTLPALQLLSIAGSGNMDVHGNFANNATFETIISGSGNIAFGQGSTQNFNSVISGSGNVAAFGLVADKATVNISGSGNTEISATSSLDVTISGSGDVYYKGSPTVTSHISGSGSVIPR